MTLSMNEIQHNDIQHNNTQHNDTQNSIILNTSFRIMALHSKSQLCWVSQISPKHSVIMLHVVMLSVVMLSVIMLSVEAPFITPFQLHPLYCIIIKKPVVPLTLIVSWFVHRRILDFATGIDYMIGGGIYGQVSILKNLFLCRQFPGQIW